MPKAKTKNTSFGYFSAGILRKTIVIFEISTLKFVKIEFLTQTVDFGTWSAFCKCRECTFSKSPGPGFGSTL